VAAVAAVAAFAGDQAGYWLGKRFGRGLFKPDARVLKTERLEQAEAFFARYGGVSLVLGRFVPFVRTYVPLAAGIAAMRYPRFLLWNALGGVSWTIVMVVLGVLLGGIPFVANNIDVLMIVVVAVSILPLVIHAIRQRRSRSKERRAEESAALD
jgi:membrane-associated protein